MAQPTDPPAPFSRRVPAWQSAGLILVVCACAALNIYGHPHSTVRNLSLLLGGGALVMAVAAMRMYLVVDDEGVAVRHVRHSHWLPWEEIERAEVVSGVRGGDTIRFTRPGGEYVDVPPSLLQPGRPTSRPRAFAQLGGMLQEILEHRPRGARP